VALSSLAAWLAKQMVATARIAWSGEDGGLDDGLDGGAPVPTELDTAQDGEYTS